MNLDTQLGDEPLIRAVDLAAHVEDTRAGLPAFDSQVFVTLTPTVGDVAARTGMKVTRFDIDGLGWMEGVRFASLATGRRFVVYRQLSYPLEPPRTSVITHAYPAAAEGRAEVLADLFDMLLIDSDEVHWCEVDPIYRWRLMRTDDNGNTVLIRSFTGYAKARSELAQYEAKLHKQSYWLELESRTD